ncbi:MAG: RHS repeat-associated core domain-containing protein [Anaerolinea sp.]|nr:RHS repeat-associated core domain-containing protein [Anaerolinea sp.]
MDSAKTLHGVPLQSNTATTLGFTGEQTDPLGLVNLRARTYNPRWGTFTNVDPVLGVGGSTGWNGYVYANANPANFVDPAGTCVGPITVVCLGIAIVGGAFAGGFAYGTASHLGKGGNFGDALGQGLLWGTGSAAVVGGLGFLAPQTMSGVLLGAAGLAKGMLAPAAAWLAKRSVLKWGLIGAEAEWGRQTVENLFPYDTQAGQFYSNIAWDAVHPARYDWWKIAKAGVFSGASRAVLGAFGYTGQRISFRLITQDTSSAAYLGGFIGLVTGVISKSRDNRFHGLRNLQELSGLSIADIAWSYLAGAIVGGLSSYVSPAGLFKPLDNAWSYSSRTGFILNLPSIARTVGKDLYTVSWYMGVGIAPTIGQTALDIVEGVNPRCRAGNGIGAGAFTNLASLISNPQGFVFAALVGGILANEAVNSCSWR